MKYWNRDKKVRIAHWTKIHRSRSPFQPYSEYFFLKRWCQLQPSAGRFYAYPAGADTWWFEHPEDATWFVMNWGR